MQEFSSISVSSYEAGSLADRLTEQARHGWSVVAIVPTGSTITAYLSREAGEGADQADAPVVEAAPEPAYVIAEPVAEPAAEPETSWSALAESAAAEAAPEPISVPEVTIPEITVPEAPVAEPVSEPAGWAVAPETASAPAAEPAPAADPMAGLGSYTSSYDAGAAAVTEAQPSVPAETYVAEPAAAVAAETSYVAEAQQAAAAASAAPAGWYADPSSRYELRYWDGTQWTEHVSRAGQQFTDPPVA